MFWFWRSMGEVLLLTSQRWRGVICSSEDRKTLFELSHLSSFSDSCTCKLNIFGFGPLIKQKQDVKTLPWTNANIL